MQRFVRRYSQSKENNDNNGNLAAVELKVVCRSYKLAVSRRKSELIT